MREDNHGLMEQQAKQVTYSSSNTYLTANTRGERTKNTWVVFHGIGYLSQYFIKYFEILDAGENYIVAPQAPAKYYIDKHYKHVGASWLTRVDKEVEIENTIRYMQAVTDAEKLGEAGPLTVFGFSQGVSMALRWAARQKINCRQILLYAGSIPEELEARDFDFLPDTTRIVLLAGKQDEFLTAARMEREIHKATELFGHTVEFLSFEGGHEVKPELLKQFA